MLLHYAIIVPYSHYNRQSQPLWIDWCFQKDSQESLGCKEFKPVNPKGIDLWIFIGRTDAGAEGPILWPPDAKSLFIRKDTDAGKDWRQEEKGLTEDKMVGWHHRLNGPEFEQAPGDVEGWGSLAWCSPWGHKESDMTERLNNDFVTVFPRILSSLKSEMMPQSFLYLCI